MGRSLAGQGSGEISVVNKGGVNTIKVPHVHV
jgi:hypothetical protein